MFLIEYQKGMYLNAELISKVSITASSVSVFIDGYVTGVGSGYEGIFLNNLQALNQNIQNIESRCHKIKGGS